MTTPHNEAKKNQLAKTVLMPGDPLRAKFIAENYLEDVIQFNNVRNMYGYTGYYKGKKVSVMGSGMGMPSMGIYCHELYSQYDVETIIRVGSCGSYQKDVHIRDLILVQASSTDSAFAYQYGLQGTYSAISTYELLEAAVSVAKEKEVPYHVGNILASDIFYNADSTVVSKWAAMNVLGVEMESYALFATAATLRKKAFTILTVSDSLVSNEATTASEREKSFTDMMEIALEIA